MQEVGKTPVSLDHLSEHYHIMIGHKTRNLLYSTDFERSQLLVDSEKKFDNIIGDSRRSTNFKTLFELFESWLYIDTYLGCHITIRPSINRAFVESHDILKWLEVIITLYSKIIVEITKHNSY